MKTLILCLLSLSTPFVFAMEETVLIGPYSGRPGYFVSHGVEYQATESAILMNKSAEEMLKQQKFNGLGSTKTCIVDGMMQTIGYTIFKVKSCK